MSVFTLLSLTFLTTDQVGNTLNLMTVALFEMTLCHILLVLEGLDEGILSALIFYKELEVPVL